MKNGYFEFLAHFVDLTDPRVDRGLNHKLIDIVGLALCGTICGANSWADIERFAKANIEWFERFLDLPFGVPSHDTFSRVFQRLDTAEFQECLQHWIEQLQLQLEGETVAIDGKTVRGSHDRTTGQDCLHVINAWATQVNFCLGQISVQSKSNEIPAVRELLEILNLKGAIVTADAMHCQRATVQTIVKLEADYVLSVKDNQPKLLESIIDQVELWGENSFTDRCVRTHTRTEKNRGRMETRTCIVGPAPAGMRQRFTGLQTIGVIRRERVLADGSEQSDQSYFISSLDPKVRQHVHHLRNHWRVENSLHHTLDVTFSEDASRIRKGNGPEIISALRRMALSILKQDTTIKDNVRGKRLTAGWDLSKLEGMLLAFQAI